MDRLTWRTSDGANWEGLGCFLWCAIITGRNAFLDNLNLTIESCRTTFDQRNICSNTHLVDMSPGIQIVQSIEDHCKALEPIDIELRILDVGMMCLQLHIRVEPVCSIFGNLFPLVSA